MYRSKARTIKALAANTLVEDLQFYFVNQLEGLDGVKQPFNAVEWVRDQGQHGGGVRYEATDENIFNRGSVNVSQIHYENAVSKNLASATAISTIIHPKNPYAPSVHMHISWTEMKSGRGYWRIMADLNPAIENEEDNTEFDACLKKAAPEQYALASSQGDRYFYISALGRHRGVSHFYLEEYNSDDAQADFDLASKLGKTVIDTYIGLVKKALLQHPEPDETDFQKQLAYHTLYLFQVLTLDRGTTSGLLVHDQNDAGIMGSLPAKIDKDLLLSWVDKMDTPQDKLLQAIGKALPAASPCLIDVDTKLALAAVIRQHYTTFPNALAMQAQGNSIPPTVDNHR